MIYACFTAVCLRNISTNGSSTFADVLLYAARMSSDPLALVCFGLEVRASPPSNFDGAKVDGMAREVWLCLVTAISRQPVFSFFNPDRVVTQ